MASIVISGFTSAFKVPGVFMETVFGAGEISNASAPLKCLVVGLKGSSGTITLDGTPQLALSEDDVNALVQPGSEAAREAYQALRTPGVQLYIGCPTPAGGAVAAAATITIVSTPAHATTGEWRYRISGINLSGATSTTATQNAIATAIAAAINARTDLPVTAAAVANVVTVTVKCAGIRGNQYTLFQDTTQLPTTISSTLGGGGASVTGGGIRFFNGAGTEDVTNLLTTISSKEYARIAFAQNDTTNLPIIETWLNDQSAWDVGILQNAVVGLNTDLSAATTLATVTLNTERVQLLAMQNGESHPSEMAARWAAYRSVFEQIDPAASSQYNGFALTGIAPQTQDGDRWTIAEQDVLLNNGVTPVTTNDNGEAVIIRSVTTKCLTNAVADFRTLGTERASAPDFIRRGIYLLGVAFVTANPRVQDDPATGQRPPGPGIAFPLLWTNVLTKYARDLEIGAANVVSSGLAVVTDVANNLPFSQFDPIANRIMFVFPAEIANGNHQLGGQVRQTNNG
jgi:phage tail sheath gpL-like